MKKFLFVCTGNTCRSPMAEAVFNNKMAKLGISALAFSRGLFADGSQTSENALAALSHIGICGFNHTSQTLSERDIKNADYVIGISSRHAASIIAEYPKHCEKVYSFPFDISDPFGGDIESYKKTLSEISKGIDIIIQEVLPECQ